jgi:hypothetical protein
VRHHEDPGAGVGQFLDHRQGGTHPSVVGDSGSVERYVQVRPDQNVPPPDTIGEQFVESGSSHVPKAI